MWKHWDVLLFLLVLALIFSYHIGRMSNRLRTEYCLGYTHIVDSNYPYICNGENDAEIINSAIVEGASLFLDGDFVLKELIEINVAHVTIVGGRFGARMAIIPEEPFFESNSPNDVNVSTSNLFYK